MIFSHVLYQLSYLGVTSACRRSGWAVRGAVYRGAGAACPRSNVMTGAGLRRCAAGRIAVRFGATKIPFDETAKRDP